MANKNEKPPYAILNPDMNPKQAMVALAEILEQNYDYDYQVNRFQGSLARYNTGIADGRCPNPMWRTIRRLVSDSQMTTTRFELPEQIGHMVREWTEIFENSMSWEVSREHTQTDPRERLTVARAMRYLAEVRTEPPRFSDDAWEILQLMLHNPTETPPDNEELRRQASRELDRALAQAEYSDLIPPKPWTDQGE